MSDKGMFGNLGNLMKQAQAMQERLAKVQAEVATKTVQASAGGGMVTVVANGRPLPMRRSARRARWWRKK